MPPRSPARPCPSLGASCGRGSEDDRILPIVACRHYRHYRTPALRVELDEFAPHVVFPLPEFYFGPRPGREHRGGEIPQFRARVKPRVRPDFPRLVFLAAVRAVPVVDGL